jgi:hypothetical protein
MNEMNDKIDRLVQEVVELATRDDPQAIHAKGLEAKQAIWDQVDVLQLAVNILDGIVPYKAQGLPWTIGWVNPAATATAVASPTTASALTTADPTVRPAQSVARSQRTARVLYIANEALETGGTSITTAEIAAILQRDGDTTALGSLQTGIGNILHRTGVWKRVGTGQYVYTGGSVV